MAKNAVCAGYCITVIVTSPGGRPIGDAKIVCTATGSPNEVTVQSGKDGIAIVALREDHLAAGAIPGQRGELTVRASKHHHGPVVADGATFANGPAEVSVVYEPSAQDKITIPSAANVTPPEQLLWGRPKIDAKGRLQVVLVDGGTLGQNYYELPAGAPRTIPARRMTPDADPRFPTQGISEVDQELIYRMAHGDLALNDATRAHAFYEFEHDMSIGEFEPCDPARCKLVKQPMEPVNEPAPDPVKYPGCESAPIGDRLNVFGSVLAGVRLVQVDFVGNNLPTSRLKRVDSLRCSDPFIVDVHARHILGMIRLCKRLKADYGIAAIYTAGFIRWPKDGPQPRPYVWDSHGRGRAFDLSGVAQQMPKLPSKDGKPVTQQVRPGVDFVVLYHWGRAKLQVQTTRRVGGVSTRLIERRRDNGQDFSKDPEGNGDYLLYRLDPIPETADRAVELEAPPIDGESEAEHLARSEDWTNDHYSMCRDVFQSIWAFLCREYSSTDGFLGPIENIDEKVGGRKGQNTNQFRSAQMADQATSAPAMGSVEGRTIHPDYPKGGARGPHDNHFHFQFGNSKVDTAKGDYER